MAEQEWEHSCDLYALLAEWGEDPEKVERDRAAEAYANAAALDRPLDDWAEVVAVMMVVDSAASLALEGLAEGSFGPARECIPPMIEQEPEHREEVRSWVTRLLKGKAAGRQRLQEHVARLLPGVGAWIWPDDPPAKDIIRATWDTDGEALWERWFEQMRDSLTSLELTMPEPDRKGWSERLGREPGMPDAEAVKRAQGAQASALRAGARS